MTYFAEDGSDKIVNARISAEASPRLARVMGSLVEHLHAFVKDVQPTQEEWEAGIGFLTQTGQLCSAERQEFILLSDVLGVSMLVDAINNRRPAGATENTVLGPFYVPGGPVHAMGHTICLDGKGELCRFEGLVTHLDGQPIGGARIDVWSDNADGFYDVQQPDVQPRWNNRGSFVTGDDGAYSFIGIKPVSYPIPDDGPVGQMLDKLGRHPFRPAHIHFIVSAPGCQKLVTHTFVGMPISLAMRCSASRTRWWRRSSGSTMANSAGGHRSTLCCAACRRHERTPPGLQAITCRSWSRGFYVLLVMNPI